MFLHLLDSQDHKRAFLEIAHLAAAADGYVNHNENKFLRTYLAEMNIQKAHFNADRKLPDILAGIEDTRVKYLIFMEILLLVYSDGDFNDDERLIVTEMRQIIGISDDFYASLKDWVIRVGDLRVEGLKLILS